MIFLNPSRSAAAPMFDQTLCTHTEGKPSEARVRNIFQNINLKYLKNTIFDKQCTFAMLPLNITILLADRYPSLWYDLLMVVLVGV